MNILKCFFKQAIILPIFKDEAFLKLKLGPGYRPTKTERQNVPWHKEQG